MLKSSAAEGFHTILRGSSPNKNWDWVSETVEPTKTKDLDLLTKHQGLNCSTNTQFGLDMIWPSEWKYDQQKGETSSKNGYFEMDLSEEHVKTIVFD